MRTVRNVVGILFGSIALAICACSPTLSPTTPQVTPPGQAAIQPKDRESALAVIERAVQAHGGKDALARTKNIIRDGTGTILVGKAPQPITDHTTFAFPDRANMQSELGFQKIKTQTVLNGDQAWEVASNQTRTMTPDEVQILKQDLFLIWLSTLTPLQSDAVEVGILEDGKVDNRPVAVVHVKGTNKIGKQQDVELSFDKETGLLVKARLTGFNKEHVYSGHKAFDGVKMPTRELIINNGVTQIDVTFTSWTFPAFASEVEFKMP